MHLFKGVYSKTINFNGLLIYYSFGRLRSEFEDFLVRAASSLVDRRQQLIFLINNYDLINMVFGVSSYQSLKEESFMK